MTASLANVTVRHVVLGATRERISLLQGRDALGAPSRVLGDKEGKQAGVIEVTVERGDGFGETDNQIMNPTVLKIDTECSELDVLRGLENTIKQPCIHAVLVEVHFTLLEERGQFDAPAKIEAMLGSAGFGCVWPDLSHIAGIRPAK